MNRRVAGVLLRSCLGLAACGPAPAHTDGGGDAVDGRASTTDAAARDGALPPLDAPATDATTPPADALPGTDAPAPPTDGSVAGGDRATLARYFRGSNRFMMGMGNDLRGAPDYDHDMDGAYVLGPALDVHYVYLVGLGGPSGIAGCTGSNGWPTWNAGGTFADIMMNTAHAHGVTPMFTYYGMASCGDGNLAGLTNDTFMHSYLTDIKLLFQRIAAFGQPVIVQFEPDFWGYLQQHAIAMHVDATGLPVHIHGGGFTDCGTLPDTAAGFGQCLVHLARTYAPSARIGFHASPWASTVDVDRNTSPSVDPAAEGRKVGQFLVSAGAADTDVVFVDMIDRDAGCYEAGDGTCGSSPQTGVYWDESNAALPDFHQHFSWANAVYGAVGHGLIWWQLPFGVPSATPGGTAGHYRDNRVHYLFAHVDEMVAAGGLGAVFGTGAGGQTYVTSDGNQFHDAVAGYDAHPVALP